MRQLDFKRAFYSTLMVWMLGVMAFTVSYLVPVIDDPDVQANWVLSFTIIPAGIIGARFYYLKGNGTNGWVLGGFMFFITIILDACITVPLLIKPFGGDHASFFADPNFWFIGLEYIVVITAYWGFNRHIFQT